MLSNRLAEFGQARNGHIAFLASMVTQRINQPLGRRKRCLAEGHVSDIDAVGTHLVDQFVGGQR